MSEIEIAAAKRTAEKMREIAGEFSVIAWALDERLRNLRIAEENQHTRPEDRAKLASLAIEAHKSAETFLARFYKP